MSCVVSFMNCGDLIYLGRKIEQFLSKGLEMGKIWKEQIWEGLKSGGLVPGCVSESDVGRFLGVWLSKQFIWLMELDVKEKRHHSN